MSAARRLREDIADDAPVTRGELRIAIARLGDRLLTGERRPIPPCDLDAERDLVSSALWGYVHPELRPLHFFASTWRALYEIALVYAARRIRPTMEHLIEAIRASGEIAEAFAPDLRSLLEAPVLTRPAEAAERVIRLAAKRRALELVLRAEELLRACEGDVDRAVELLVEAADAAQGAK